MTPVMQTNSCGNVLLFFVSCVLSHNFIFSRFLGCCPFLGVSNKVETAAGMGLAVLAVGLASLPLPLLLGVQILTGILVYIILCYALKIESFIYGLNMLREMLKGRRTE